MVYAGIKATCSLHILFGFRINCFLKMPKPKLTVFNADSVLGHSLVRHLLLPEHRESIGHVHATVKDLAHCGDLPASGASLLKVGELPSVGDVQRLITECDTIILVPDCTSPKMVEQAKVIIDAVKGEGIERLMVASLVGATDTTIGLSLAFNEIETYVKQSGIENAAIVRHAPFQQEMLWYREQIQEGYLAFPVPEETKFNFVDMADVSELMAHLVLKVKRWRSSANSKDNVMVWQLTGSNAFSAGEISSILSDILGRKIKYHQMNIDGYRKYLRAQTGIPNKCIEDMVDKMQLAMKNHFGFVSDDQKKSTGKEPKSLTTWVKENNYVLRMDQETS